MKRLYMKSFLWPLPLVLLGFFFDPSSASAKVSKLVGAIADTSILQGAACSVSRPDKKIIFWSTDNSEVLMNINGRDQKLKLVSENQPPGRGKVGDRWTATYKSGKITVKILRVTTFVCPIGSQECEVTRYGVTEKMGLKPRPYRTAFSKIQRA
jgi:hypothetical protein